MPPIVITLYTHAFLPLCLSSTALAWLVGGRTERIVACSFVIATLAQKAAQGIAGPSFSAFEPLVAIVDIGLFITLLVVALRDPRRWLLIVCALQLLAALAHVARLADVSMSRLAYAILMGSGGYLTQLLLLFGIAAHYTRRRWTTVSEPSP